MSSQPYYWTDSHTDEFNVEVISILEANGDYYTQIKENVVKPTGGGQAGDRGHIVIEGKQFAFADTILHSDHPVLVMKHAPINFRGKATMKLDMNWRRAMMTNHTSEHIFVGLMKKKYPEIELGRIWIDGIHGTIVLEKKVIPLEEILDVESKVNKMIQDEIEVVTRVVSASEVDDSVRAREGVTSQNEIIRVVNVGEYDSSACSGIHVSNTREIRLFKVVDVKETAGNTYIEFVSGSNAVEKVSEIYNMALARKYSYPYEMEQIGAILDKSKTLQESYERTTEKILQLMKEGSTKEELNGVTFWCEYLPGLEVATLRHLMKELDMTEPSLTLFLTSGKKTNIVVWTKGMPKDTAYYIADIVQDLGGKGGGSAESYTGGFSDPSNPEDLFLKIVEKVKSRIQE